MDPARLALLQHLDAALAAYGPDVPIAVPAPTQEPRALAPAARPIPAAVATSQAQEFPQAPVETPKVPENTPQARSAKPSQPHPATPASASPSSPTELPEVPPIDRASAPPLPRPPARLTGAPAAPRPAAPASAPSSAPATAASAHGSDANPIETLRAETFACRKCTLCESRKTVVFGEGNPSPEVLFVGEAPGAVEDQTGRPFVGPAGQLLDKILQGAMGLRREDVYIANVNKCRPPGNRAPEPDEVAACLPFLKRQVELLAPRVIVALGRVAAHNLLGRTEAMRDLRGRDLDYGGIPVVVTWHPAFLLRDPSHKRETWEDIKRVNRLLGRPEVPGS